MLQTLPRMASDQRYAATTGAPSANRVLVYFPHLRTGGAELAMLRLAQGLRRAGCSVTLVLHSADDVARRLAGTMPIIELGVQKTLGALMPLVRLLRREQPDFLITALTHSNIIAALAKQLAHGRTRVIVTEHAPVSALARANGTWRYRILPVLLPLAYSGADAVVSVSRGVDDDLGQLLRGVARSRMHVIYNPVLSADWASFAEAPVNDDWFADEAPPVILSVGRLSPEKNLPLLLEAFLLLRQQRPELRLALIGEGVERARLEALIEAAGCGDAVRLLGEQANPLAYMRRAAVFVLTSVFEGFGNVLVEAMATGIPVISTDCPVGPREILADGVYGRLVEQADPQRLALAIEAALAEPGDLCAAHRRAMEFTEARCVEQYCALFSCFAQRRPA